MFPTPRRAGTLLAVAAVLALLPAAALFARIPGDDSAPPPKEPGPMRFGVDVEGLEEARAAGGAPTYAMLWAGRWSADDGWRYVRESARAALAANATPVVQWYYWGGDLSREAVEHGANGKSRAQWFELAAALATTLENEARGREAIVVLETEFNHPGIVGWARFDELLAEQARVFHERAPSVRVALGFGSWEPEGWTTFPRAVAACDILGFQLLRGVERDGVPGIRGAHLAVVYTAEQLKARFPGKPLLLHDIAVTTYGHADGEALQAEAVRRILAENGTLRALGVEGMIYRSVRDVPSAPDGYYGEGEKHFGLKRADGTAKPAWPAWLAAIRANR